MPAIRSWCQSLLEHAVMQAANSALVRAASAQFNCTATLIVCMSIMMAAKLPAAPTKAESADHINVNNADTSVSTWL